MSIYDDVEKYINESRRMNMQAVMREFVGEFVRENNASKILYCISKLLICKAIQLANNETEKKYYVNILSVM